jgi:hypothetical protein
MNPARHTKNKTDCGKYKLSDLQAKYYGPTEHLALVISVLLKGSAIFKQYTPKKTQRFGVNLHLRKSMFLAVYVQTLCRGNPDCM